MSWMCRRAPRSFVYFLSLTVLISLIGSARIAAAQLAPPPWQVTVLDDATGEPIAGAEVRVRVNNANDLLNTDAAGRVAVESAVGARLVSLTVSAPQFVPVRAFWNASSSPLGVPFEGYTFRLTRGTVVGGVIQDEQGRPVPNTLIYVTLEPEDYLSRQTPPSSTPQPSIYDLPLTTDAEGRWTCDLLPAKWHSVRIRTESPDFYNAPFGERLTDADALRQRSAVLKLSKGMRIEGVVRDAQGKPIAGAILSYDADRGSRVPETVSNERGEYLFAHARPGDDLALLIRADGFAPQFRRVPQNQPNAPLDITLLPSKAIEGKVVDSGGKPMANARIIVTEYDGMRLLGDWNVHSDASGSFRLDGSDLEMQVDVLAGAGVTSGRNIVLKPGGENSIRLQRRVLVSGTILDAQTGAPIPAGRILHSYHDPQSPIWQTGQVTSFQHGIFNITLGEPGPGYLLKFEAEGYRPLISRVFKPDEGEVTYEARMSPGSGPKGIVRSPDGKPAAGALVVAALKTSQVMMENDRFTRQTMVPIVTSDAGGAYQLAPQAEDEFYIFATHESGYRRIASQELAATGSDDLKLLAWATIEGVVKIGSAPAAGARVGAIVTSSLESRNEGPRIHTTLSTTADEQGRFRLRVAPGQDVSIGRYIETAERSYTHTHTVKVTPKPGETTTIAIGGKGKPVVGRVQIPQELEQTGWRSMLSNLRSKEDVTSIPGFAAVQQMPLDQRQAWLKTEEGIAYLAAARKFEELRKYYPVNIEKDGTFRIEDVEPGNYTLQIRINASAPGQLYVPGNDGWLVNTSFTIPPIDGGQTDEPLAIPPLTLTRTPSRP